MDRTRIEQAAAEAAQSSPDGRLACTRALGVASSLGVPASEIGDAVNRLGIRIVDCQLGCFSAEKSVHDDLGDVPTTGPLANAIEAALVQGSLPCAVAFEVARETGSARKLVGDVITKKKAKISGCQLGCFS